MKGLSQFRWFQRPCTWDFGTSYCGTGFGEVYDFREDV